MIKNRIILPLLYLGMVLINIIYNVVLLVLFPILIMGSFVWSNKKFWEINKFFTDIVPTMPDFDQLKIEKDEDE